MPDIPLEETDDIRRIAGAAGLELVMLVTPTTPEARMRAIAAVSQGFVYLVSVAGAATFLFQAQGLLCLCGVLFLQSTQNLQMTSMDSGAGYQYTFLFCTSWT